MVFRSLHNFTNIKNRTKNFATSTPQFKCALVRRETIFNLLKALYKSDHQSAAKCHSAFIIFARNTDNLWTRIVASKALSWISRHTRAPAVSQNTIRSIWFTHIRPIVNSPPLVPKFCKNHFSNTLEKTLKYQRKDHPEKIPELLFLNIFR